MLTEAGIKPQTVLEFSAVEMLKDRLKASQEVAIIPAMTVSNTKLIGESRLSYSWKRSRRRPRSS